MKRHPGVKRLYNQGMTAIIQQDYSEAIQHFQNFVRQFPDDSDSDNAYYWIGHAYYKLGQYRKADGAFREVLRKYEHRPTTQGYKTPDTIFMLGKLAQEQEEDKRAIYYFEEVIKMP